MQTKIKLTKKQREELKKLKSREKNVKIFRRLQFIEMKEKGMTNTAIAPFLDVCIDTLTDWHILFNKGGFKTLCELNYDGRRKSILDDKKKAIKKYVNENSVNKLSKIQNWLKETYSITVEHSWLSRYCKKNSIYPLKKHV